MNPESFDGMKNVHWMPPSTEAADLVFDTLDDEIVYLKNRIVDLEDRHRSEADNLRIKIDEWRDQWLEWKTIAGDLYLGCICQVADMEPDHSCNYQKAREAVRFWWRREAENHG